MKAILFLFSWCFFNSAIGADYVREKNWAEQILPSIVVGMPSYLQTAAGHSFLNLYTETPLAKAAVMVVHRRGIYPDGVKASATT